MTQQLTEQKAIPAGVPSAHGACHLPSFAPLHKGNDGKMQCWVLQKTWTNHNTSFDSQTVLCLSILRSHYCVRQVGGAAEIPGSQGLSSLHMSITDISYNETEKQNQEAVSQSRTNETQFLTWIFSHSQNVFPIYLSRPNKSTCLSPDCTITTLPICFRDLLICHFSWNCLTGWVDVDQGGRRSW